MDTDAAAYIEAVEDADHAYLPQHKQDAITFFVMGCKLTPSPSVGFSDWDQLRALSLPMAAASLDGAMVALKGSPLTPENITAADHVAKKGIKGNGVDKRLAVGGTMSTLGMAATNMSLGIYVSDPGIAPAGLIGGEVGGNGSAYIHHAVNGHVTTRVAAGSGPAVNAPNGPGLFAINKEGALATLHARGETASATVSTVLGSQALHVLHSVSSYSTATAGLYWFGRNVNLPVMAQRISLLVARLQSSRSRSTARYIMSRQIYRNTTGNLARVRIFDEDGLPWLGVAYNAAGLQIWYTPLGGSPVQITLSSGNWTERKHGWYEVAVPDSAYTGTAPLQFSGEITGGTVEGPEHVIVGYDPLAEAVGAATAQQVEELAEMLTPAESVEVDKVA